MGTSPPPVRPASPAHQRFPLAISPDPIVLGVGQAGESAETWLSVRNTQNETVAVERIETSCLCIDVAGVPVRLGPREVTDLKVTFDASDDPDFEGRLSIQVTGYLTDGRVGFQTKINLEAGPEGRFLQD